MKIIEISDVANFNFKRLEEDPKVLNTVKKILQDVQLEKDKALLKYTEKFDNVLLKDILVSKSELEEAYNIIEKDIFQAIKKAIENITKYHKKQKGASWFDLTEEGSLLGQINQPLNRVGVYVPGGTAAYPTSVLMNAIPAKVAGVNEIVIATPCDEDGKVNSGVLVAAQELGIKEIYKMGGAQAIGALAYGTETVKKVDKITGPGNSFVATAKREVYGIVDIDMIAGPSDVTIIADETAEPKHVATDLMAQAEHDPNSSANLISNSLQFLERVQDEIDKKIDHFKRKKIIINSLEKNSYMYVVKSLEDAFNLSNLLAPEHLQVIVENPIQYLYLIKNAGAIFLGSYTPTAVGDYIGGPSHVLPTSGTSKYASPLNVDDFMKSSSLIYYSKNELIKNSKDIIDLARFEGLDAHAESVAIRLDD